MPDIPKYKESLNKEILWSIISKAAEKSRKNNAEFFYCQWIKGDHFEYEVEQFQ